MRALLATGGEVVDLDCALPWVDARLLAAADGMAQTGPDPDPELVPTMRVAVEEAHKPFDTSGWARLSRDAWSRGGQIVVRDVVTSGFDLWLQAPDAAGLDAVPEFTFRWRPPARTRAAAVLLRARDRLLVRAALLQYPTLWVAACRGRAPVHASCVTGHTAGPVLLAGPSGVGKTTLVAAETARGGWAATDNLGVSDGTTVWGVVEPMRSETGHGKAAPHGRREGRLPRRARALRPTTVVALRRGPVTVVDELDPAAAARTLVAATYAAGELRRYWPLHALLALGTGTGPAHPPVQQVADTFARRAACRSVQLDHVHGVCLGELLDGKEVPAWM
jgi:hypothetical protein